MMKHGHPDPYKKVNLRLWMRLAYLPVLSLLNPWSCSMVEEHAPLPSLALVPGSFAPAVFGNDFWQRVYNVPVQ